MVRAFREEPEVGVEIPIAVARVVPSGANATEHAQPQVPAEFPPRDQIAELRAHPAINELAHRVAEDLVIGAAGRSPQGAAYLRSWLGIFAGLSASPRIHSVVSVSTAASSSNGSPSESHV